LKQKIIKRRKKLPKEVFFILLLIAILWIPGFFLFQYSFGFADSKIGGVFWNTKNSLFNIRDQVAGPQAIQKLKDEKIELLKENALLKKKIKEDSIKMEDDSLQSTFTLKELKIIGRDNFLDTPIIFLDGGESKGVKKGMAVTDHKGSLLGIIDESQEKISRVKLTPHHKSRVNGVIAGTNWNGIVEGKRNSKAVLKMLSLESEPQEGNPVVTDNSNPNIPSGLLIGELKEIGESEDHLFKEAFLELPWDIEKLEKAWVVIGRR